MKRYYIGSLALIIVAGCYPVAAMFVASFVANAAGCKLDEGDVHACIIHGHDYGPRLYDMAVSFWLIMFTLPAAEFAFLIWLVVLIIHIARRRRARAVHARQSAAPEQ